MDEETSPADASFAAGSTLAEELIVLIMSGEKPAVAADTHGETDPVPPSVVTAVPPGTAEPENRSAGPATPADNGAFWAKPPTASRLPHPRVEAVFVRGPAQYQTHNAVPPAHDKTHSTRKAVHVADTATPPAPQPRTRARAKAHLALVEAVSPQSTAQVRSHEPAAPERNDASSTRRSSEPQSQTNGLAIAHGAEGRDVSGSTQPTDPVAAEANTPTQASALAAAIDPYLQPPPDTAAQETSDREEGRRGWHKT